MENAQSNPILNFVTQLDPTNDELWTADGLPKVDVVQKGLGNDNITRQAITNAAPTFSRETQREAEKPDAPEPVAENQEVTTNEKELEGVSLPDTAAPEDPPQQTEPVPEVADVEVATPAPEPGPELVAEPPTTEVGLPQDQPQLDRFQAELEEKTVLMNEAQVKATAARKEADSLSNEVNTLNRKIDMLIKSDPNASTAGVRAYIKQQNKNREERAGAIKRFVTATSMDPRDVAKALGPAPIDAAMRNRKPARGTARPNWPAAQRMNS